MAYPTYEKPFSTEIKVGDKSISITVGTFSEQVSGAVLAKCGETVVHTTVALGRKTDWGYFPLSVEYIEKLYAAGIIKGSRWVKRDGRPSDDAVLRARVIDRTMRPLFPDGMEHEVQIVSTIFSFDQENDPDMLALLSAGIALQISDIPFDGPVAGLRVGYRKQDESFVLNPTVSEQAESDLDLVVSGTGESIVMVEAGGDEVDEQVILKGLEMAQTEFKLICAEIEKLGKKIGREKKEVIEIDAEADAAAEALVERVVADFAAELRAAVELKANLENPQIEELVEKISAKLNKGLEEDSEGFVPAKAISGAVDTLMKKIARNMILTEGVRPDGRKTDEVRQIWSEIDVFPRTHGSAMFKRGATQALTITTLGSPSLGQHIEDMGGEEVRHYMHFYNMPPYASGEAGRIGYPRRREVGHGALAERALLPMIPDQEEFPYAIHVVSEIMSSNGSTSQASVCGSTMSLMAAGVPIKRPVSGIAMGLMSDGAGKYVVLSDIQGLEDHIGDMDFKVAGSEQGITAIQMDIKLKGIPHEIMVKALEQSKAGRMHILGEMLKTISEPRTELSKYAPRIQQLTIPADRIGELIGPGGKMIKSIIEETGAEIDVDEDEEEKVGRVSISSPDPEKIQAAYDFISNMMREVKVGEEFDGTVTRVENYGAFVEILPNKEGLVHVSAMSTEYVSDPSELVKLGDTVHVRVSEIKDDGKIGLSMLSEEEAKSARSNTGDRPSFRGGGDRGSRGGDRGGRGRSGGYGGDRRGGDRGRSRGGSQGGGRQSDR